MSDYPNPEEEFELMYGDEFELLKEQEEFEPAKKCRKSLDFYSPSTSKNKEILTTNPSPQATFNLNVSQSSLALEQTDSTLVQQNMVDVDSINIPQKETQEFLNSLHEVTNSKKRTVNDLFGDITDITDDFYFDDQPNVKKQKRDQQSENLALIEHILKLRKISKEKHINGSVIRKKYFDWSTNAERDKYNLSYRVPKWPFIGVTRSDKQKVYVRFHSEEYEAEERVRIVEKCAFNSVLGDNFKEIWKEAKYLLNAQMDKNTSHDSQKHDDVQLIDQSDTTKDLWAEIYKPKKYFELLSDESTNRIMLRWIKLWDKVVFNRKPKIKPVLPQQNNTKTKFFHKVELNTNLEEDGRPANKVALLCGPPGLGKTTLAHLVAKHAGYNVVEVNASDSRTTEAFRTSLENATQMRSVVDSEKRPNCLIFDEIDGAPHASIDYLVKFINGTANPKKKSKNEKKAVLKRPIICICNDVYVPSLKPLRQIAFVVRFPQTSSSRLAERLMEIARKQNVKTDFGAMMALAEKSNNDIRSCLSILHFFKARNKPVTLTEVYKTSVGQKDVQKGLFSVWTSIFQIERQQKNASEQSSTQLDSLKPRMSKIIQTISSFGDYEMVAQGVFENYPLLKLKNSSMESISCSLDWFIFSDIINKQIYATQNYGLGTYLQYAFVFWHFVFASYQKPSITMPNAGFEARQKEARQKAVINEIVRGMQPTMRIYCQPLSLILDILPLVTKIIEPSFRPVSIHLYSNEEKQLLLKVVHIMISLNLNYVQERTLEGTYNYVLEPHIEELIYFGKDKTKFKGLSYFNRQLIAREIELEKVKKIEAFRNTEKAVQKTEKVLIKSPENSHLPNHLQKLKAKTVKSNKPTVTRDFFGRIIEKPAAAKGKTELFINNDIWYQYKEGYNNAVRKKIKISSLK